MDCRAKIAEKKLRRAANVIGRGGVYGATAAIFREGNPFPGRKILSLHFSVVPEGRG